MAEKREYAPRRTTPIGVLKFPHILKADAKFNPEKPRYKSNVVLPGAEAAKLIDAIMTDEKFGMPAAERMRDEAIAAAKRAGKKLPPKKDPANAEQLIPYSGVVDRDSGDETGEIEVKIAGNASYKDKKTGETKQLTVKLFDAKGNELVGRMRPKDIWGGTRARVSYTHFPYYNSATNEYGVSLRLEAVKIIELRAGGGAGADDYGFGDEEEGYEATAMEADESADETGDEGDTGGELPTDADF